MQLTGLKLAIASIAIAASAVTSAHAGSFGSNQSFANYSVFAAFKANNLRTSRSIIKAAARVYGERCVTPRGSCTIHPQPVGSPCRCGNVDGKTLQ